jgi:hypothetical protein
MHHQLTFYDSDFVKYFNNRQPIRPGQDHGQLRSGRVLAEETATIVKVQRSEYLLDSNSDGPRLVVSISVGLNKPPTTFYPC